MKAPVAFPPEVGPHLQNVRTVEEPDGLTVYHQDIDTGVALAPGPLDRIPIAAEAAGRLVFV